uniref:IFT81_CH domain-containing protein n=1 Tax=Heterorhabditis bacteriophora TaxID=37862 RepID=A0A1I7XI38_HETBA
MKDWQEILSLYKTDNVYLAESAQILQRLVQYEIPGLKKQIAKIDQSLEESIRKGKDYERYAEEGRKSYEKELIRMGVKGEALRCELLSLAADLPSFFYLVYDMIKKLMDAREFYIRFRNYMNKNCPSSQVLPLLGLIMEKGSDVTAYEWMYGIAPDRVEAPSFDLLLKKDEKNTDDEDDIDFGDTEIVMSEDSQINVIADDKGVVGDLVASGKEALCVLENPVTQNIVKQELNELLAFLTMRREDEDRETAADMFIRGAEIRPENIRKVESAQLYDWMTQCSSILDRLNCPQKNHLFKIRSLPHYVESLVSEIDTKRGLEERYKRMQQLMLSKQDELKEQSAKMRQELTYVVEGTKKLQNELQSEISKKYNGRRVNLMGAITVALNSL